MKILTAAFFSLAFKLSCAQAPSIQWQRCYGGTGGEDMEDTHGIAAATDGGVLLCGFTTSFDGDVTGYHGGNYWDSWILKLDSSGSVDWERAYGGTEGDESRAVLNTLDNGYMFVGYSASNDNDVGNNYGESDFWVVKLSHNGNVQWEKNYGGSNSEWANYVIQTYDSGFVIVGATNSNDSDVIGLHDLPSIATDIWVIKIDGVGNLKWQKCLGGFFSGGGSGNDEGFSIKETIDKGFIVGAWTGSDNGDVNGNHGGWDYWMVKLDSTGDFQWQKCFGGSSLDQGKFAIPTSDAGYIMVGGTLSTNGDVTGNHGGEDFWVIKMDNVGNILWQKCYGGTDDDLAWNIIEDRNGGYVISGTTYSVDGDVIGNNGFEDYWVIKIDSAGNLIWQKCLGGSGLEQGTILTQTSDGGIIVAGNTGSTDGDVTGGGNHGNGDFWVVKLSPSGTNIQSTSPLVNFSAYLDDKLYLSVSSTTFIQGVLQLIDVTGRIILESPLEIKNGFNKNEIQIPSLSPAVYIVNLKTSLGNVTTKVVSGTR